MKPARRNGKIAPRKRRRRLGTMLFVIGLLAVLGGTFAVGALAGRLSLHPSALLASGSKTPTRAEKPASPAQPELTFYRELTAPLSAPAATPPSARPGSKRDADSSRATDSARGGDTARSSDGARAAEPSALELPARELDRPRVANATIAAPRGDGGRYTVQVASYNARAQADAMRARLAALGIDAYVAEGEAAGVARYRVRVGTYDTAEEARQAAARIGAQGQVATYVTTR